MRIGHHDVGESAPSAFIIAEVASAHEGDVDRAQAITRAAAEAGADCVKYQIWSRDECFASDHTQYEVFGRLEFSRAQWLQIMGHAHSLGISIAADVDDVASTQLALEGGAELLKIRTTNLAHHELLEVAARSGRPIGLATGASTPEEITRGLDVLVKHGARDVVLMHGFQAFPTTAADTHLRSLSQLRQQFGMLVGYADHADGDSPLAYLLPAAALAAGACMIEKHITIDREEQTEDFESSLNGPQFKIMVDQLKQVTQALGTAVHDLTEAEHAYRARFKKSLVSRCEITIGQTVTADMLAFKIGARLGIAIDQADVIVGATAAVDIAADSIIQRDMVR